MSYKGHKVLAVIPARGGSKGIPRKNLCRVGGITLVGHAIRVAKSVEWLDRILLSTDDMEIAEEGRRYGLDIPFMRPPELATDTANSVDMWKHAWLGAEAHYGVAFDLSVLLEPTSPLRRPDDVESTVSSLLNGDHLAAATVSRAPAHFTPQKCLTVDFQNYIGFYLKNGAKFSQRQKIPAYYFRNGVCYAVRRETLIDKGQILEERCVAVILDRPLVNIDEPFDIELVEFLLSKKKILSP